MFKLKRKRKIKRRLSINYRFLIKPSFRKILALQKRLMFLRAKRLMR